MRRLGTFARSLSARVVVLMTLALLPLGILSLYQTKTVMDEAQVFTRASLMSETVAASHAERELFQQALGAAQGLGAMAMSAAGPLCQTAMADFVTAHPVFVFAGFIQTDGQMVCSSSDQVYDFAGTAEFEEAIRENGPVINMRHQGVVSGESVAIVIQPIYRDNDLRGLAVVSIPHRVANGTLNLVDTPEPKDLRLLTVNAKGEIVVSNDGAEDAEQLLPRDVQPEQLVGIAGSTFEATARNGERRLFAVSELLPGSVVLVGSAPYDFGDGLVSSLQTRLALAFPLLMWITGIVVAYLGMQRLVVRHVRGLRSAMRRFALGDRTVGSLTLDNPAEELAEAERAFNRMALLISEAEQRRDQDLRDKKVLLKEVHHRVKNNLQLIASIMNMQMRTATSAEARFLLEGLQRRVRGLAMLHRALYAAPDLTTVDGADLLQAVVDDATQALLAPNIELTTDLANVELYPDQAVPLSMLSAEALTNALKYATASSKGDARIKVELHVTDDASQVTLRICNTKNDKAVNEHFDSLQSSGLGRKLMRAFEAQLDTRAEVVDEEGCYTYSVTFERVDFEPEKKGERAA
ncbi:sensor histidine kinase [Tropicibacter naphthalenivorans]|uniref:histidine kinase n=1 Tax=Tropicibacter naphthalenivorans TaxID=441103 RepID=A0A0N7LYR9_9RHOB|nr:sensor histidine kinase [Tropicibacter naphthalenivorans]CUH75633.1 putative sensor histidine kinase pdtaS [Tropicibacter naphthalenivorans]SMC43106.1 Two-component sensor histidine kinase, contains HisKA and HATPase domains [Tropicibacter naphthalenivorans]